MSVLKTAVLLNIVVKTLIRFFFQDLLMNSISSKEHHLLETDFFCNNVMSLMSLLINLMHPSCIHFFKTKS